MQVVVVVALFAYNAATWSGAAGGGGGEWRGQCDLW